MDIRVSVVIMAHPKRSHFIPELLEKLDRPADVVWDQLNNRWNTGRRAMLAYEAAATHHLVLQDDAIACRDLVAGVERALEYVPDGSPLSLYCGQTRPYRELVQRLVDQATGDTSWLTMGQLHWGVGIVVPTKWISDMIAWCDKHADVANYDKRISRWCQHQGLTVYYTWPSLVEHRCSPSLVPGRWSPNRRAHRFIGAEASALELRWDGEVVSIPAPNHSSRYTVPSVFAVPARPRRPKLGVAVKFVSRQYRQLQVTPAKVRFRDGVAETRDPDAIEMLLALRHLGVEPLDGAAAGVEQAAAEPVTVAADRAVGSQAGPTGNTDGGLEDAAGVGTSESSGVSAVPAGGAREVLVWVGDDPQRAAEALRAEEARDKPRTTLVATLSKLAG